MKKIFQQPAAHIELDERELEQITGGCSSRKHKHLPPPPPQHRHNSPAPHSGFFGGQQGSQPGGQQGGQPGGFGGH